MAARGPLPGSKSTSSHDQGDGGQDDCDEQMIGICAKIAGDLEPGRIDAPDAEAIGATQFFRAAPFKTPPRFSVFRFGAARPAPFRGISREDRSDPRS